jgi:hypothetical protein
MANQTITSGNTITVSQPLTSGTNIDFLNDAGNSGSLIVTPTALRITTVTNAGTTSLVSAAIGGTIVNFQPGDQVSLQNIPSFFSELDFAADAAAQNAAFANQMSLAALSGIVLFINPDGSVTTSVNTPFSLSSEAVTILDDIRASVFGTNAATDNAVLTISLGERANPNGNNPRFLVDGVISTASPINPCFAAGTRILTAQGEIPVETLRPGQTVITYDGEEEQITWVGHRTLDLTRHPRPETVQPVIIEPNALSDGVPASRLTLSPDHALYLDKLLVQAKDLINGTTIRQDTTAKSITYHHIELSTHNIILAEGTPAETYLDTGHRGVFDNTNTPIILHPNLMQIRREAEGCAPLCTGGPALAQIRHRLAQRLTTDGVRGVG